MIEPDKDTKGIVQVELRAGDWYDVNYIADDDYICCGGIACGRTPDRLDVIYCEECPLCDNHVHYTELNLRIVFNIPKKEAE